MARVLGLEGLDISHDVTYELTTDNMKKIFAIHMRQRYIDATSLYIHRLVDISICTQGSFVFIELLSMSVLCI